MKTSYKTLKELKEAIKAYASNDYLNRTDKFDSVHKIKLTIPNSLNEIVKNSDLNIVDLPGIENYYWASKIETYLDKHQDTVIPLFVIDLT